jgi:hypothetical protein
LFWYHASDVLIAGGRCCFLVSSLCVGVEVADVLEL